MLKILALIVSRDRFLA